MALICPRSYHTGISCVSKVNYIFESTLIDFSAYIDHCKSIFTEAYTVNESKWQKIQLSPRTPWNNTRINSWPYIFCNVCSPLLWYGGSFQFDRWQFSLCSNKANYMAAMNLTSKLQPNNNMADIIRAQSKGSKNRTMSILQKKTSHPFK